MRKHTFFIRLFFAAAIAYTTWKVFDWNVSSSNVVNKVEDRDTIVQPDDRMKQQKLPPQHNEEQIKLMQQKQQAAQPPPTQQPLQQSTQQTQLQQQSATSLISSAPTASKSVEVKPTRQAASAFNSSARIPRILHQAFKSEMVYENYLPYINGCLTLNPDWTYYLWRDSDAKELIASAYPEFLAKYKKYSDVLERADSIRYIVLHHFGGIYLDMDVQCVKPFFPALADLNSFLDQERIEQTNIFWNWPYSVMNSAMGSAPGHPFFREVIDEMLRQSRIGNAFATTGPTILTKVYKQYTAVKPAVPVNLLEPKVAFLLFVSLRQFWRESRRPPAAQFPRLLHQVFSSELVYENYRPYINSCLAANPDFTYVLWRNSDAERLLADHFPDLLSIYRGYKSDLQRSDVVRYAALYIFGGVYLDMDIHCLRPLTPLLDKALQLSAALLDQERQEQTRIVWGRAFLAMNSAMAAPPRHPFFRFMLHALPEWSGIDSIVHSTGPQLLTRKYAEYSLAGRKPPVSLLPYGLFSAWMDPNKNWKRLCVQELEREADETGTISPDEVEKDRWRRFGCRQLAAKHWRLDEVNRIPEDGREASLGVHRFLHLGYDFAESERMGRFNLSEAFPGRVVFYNQIAPTMGILTGDG